MYPGIAVAVGDEELAGVRVNRDVRALIEGPSAHRRGGFSRRSDSHQDFALERALAHRMIEGIGEPDRVVGAHRHSVRIREGLLVAPAMQILAVAIDDDDRRVSAIEEIDAVLRIYYDSRDIVV